ncbi:MAG: hypothetical protein JW881_00380 [Spirochaetales bacterium]|nr:hypothetical protein [Spirochaetales bacterium]
MTEKPFIREYTLSELFEGTFRMLKHTWKNTLITAVPAYFIISFSTILWMGPYFEFISKIVQGDLSANPYAVFSAIGPFLSAILIASIVGGLLLLFARAVIVLTAFRAAKNESTDIKEIILVVLKEKLGKLVLQVLLLVAIFAGGYLAVAIAIGLTGGLFSLISGVLSGIIVAVGIIVAIGFIIWLVYSFNFIQEDVLYSDAGVVQSFKNSFKLVNQSWWRVFGYLLVFSLALSFAVSIVTGPITFSVMMPFYSSLFEQVLDNAANYDMTRMYDLIKEMFSNAVVPIFIASFLSGVATIFISPLFSALFYIDLRVKNEKTEKLSSIPADVEYSEPPPDGDL